MVPISRVYLGCHYYGDVIFGAFVAFVTTSIVVLVMRIAFVYAQLLWLSR